MRVLNKLYLHLKCRKQETYFVTMPGARCAVAVCSNNFKGAKEKGLDISFHSFPKDEKLRKLWIERTYRKDNFNAKTSVICGEHFAKEDYEINFQLELTGIPRKKFLLKTGKCTSR